ncbi:hypothetical protein EJB05_50725, partial [Eragrostis curvula]
AFLPVAGCVGRSPTSPRAANTDVLSDACGRQGSPAPSVGFFPICKNRQIELAVRRRILLATVEGFASFGDERQQAAS